MMTCVNMVHQLVSSLQMYLTAGVAFCRSLLIDDKGSTIGDDFSLREEFSIALSLRYALSGNEVSKFLCIHV